MWTLQMVWLHDGQVLTALPIFIVPPRDTTIGRGYKDDAMFLAPDCDYLATLAHPHLHCSAVVHSFSFRECSSCSAASSLACGSHLPHADLLVPQKYIMASVSLPTSWQYEQSVTKSVIANFLSPPLLLPSL